VNKSFPGLGASVVLLAAALAAQVGASLAWLGAFGPGLDLTLLAGLANLSALVPVAAAGYAMAHEGPSFRASTPVAPRWWLALGLTAVGGTVVLGEAANVTAWLVPLPPELASLFNRLTEAPAPVALFTLSVVAPLTEEGLFRGLLLRGFARRYGVWAGLTMSSALFALFHLNLWQALAAFAAGFYLGWVYLASGSLVYPMAVHAVFNGLPVVLAAAGLTVTGYNTPAKAGAVEFQPLPWTLGGAVLLAAGLWLTRRWSPLSPKPVSDTVAP